MTMNKLKNQLFNAIILLYDNGDYNGIDNAEFINYIYTELNMTREEYEELIQTEN